MSNKRQASVGVFYLFTFVLIGMLLYMSYPRTLPTHQCVIPECKHNGEVMDERTFTSQLGCEEGTDCYYTELTHFMNPSWTYSESEQHAMSIPD